MFKEKYNKRLAAALTLNGFEEPKEMQLKAIPKINGGFDVIGIGPLNSGRTSLIVMSTIHKLQRAFEDAPRALILVSNMDKALAMKEKFLLFAKDTDLRIYSVSEEGKIDKEAAEIYVGTDILIGTPKRILDLYFVRNLNLNKIKLFAIDDAEMMIKIAAQGHIDRLALSLPRCQHLIFTDNYTEKVEKLIHKFIVAPQIIEVKA